LLVLHAVFYNVFFFMSSIWLKRFFAPVVFAGVVAFTCLHTLNGTSMAKMREQSYRVFFVVHLVTAMAVPPLIFFHAPSMRIYVSLAIGFLVLDLAVRKMTTINAPSVVESIPGTDLLRITSKMPANKVIKFKARPGAHLYLSLPPLSRPVPKDPYSKANFLFDFMYNPFTVVSADEDSGHLTFVARKRTGPMTTRLAEFVGVGTPEDPETQTPLCIEGPYGALSRTFSDLVDNDISRILLVAGGVGATFAVPIYHALLAESPAAHIQFVWAIRSPGDATWVPPNPAGKSLIDDDQVQLFLTGDMGVSQCRNETGDGVEMSDLRRSPVEQNHKRPNFQKLVDDAFKSGADETVAVLVCGPVEMGRELRRCITPWVMKGRSVWWHNESFGW
jgi:NAD(P)H-flavin reductase